MHNYSSLYWLILSISIIQIGCRSDVKTTVVEPSGETVVYDSDGDGYYSDEDCDDLDSNTHPNAAELCDNMDNNCDGVVDEGVLLVFYLDADSDGFGDATQEMWACEQNLGYVPNDNDCDDSSDAIYPSAPEICDGLDNNCDNNIDENVSLLFYLDADNDGFGDAQNPIYLCGETEGYVSDNTDCDDTNTLIFPNNLEYCDGLDNNCNQIIDDEAVDAEIFFADRDTDGFGDPNLPEYACTQPSNTVTNNLDCDDINTNVHPNATEICDFIDNNCDGLQDIDDPNVQGSSVYYQDNDGDGFGNNAVTQLFCFETIGWSGDNTDCDDTEPTANPMQPEICDGIDNDCDTLIDDADPSVDSNGFGIFYADVDQDGFGDINSPINQCFIGSASANSLDCNDNNAAIHPNTMWYADADQDGFGNPSQSVQMCTPPAQYIQDNLDCDDTDPVINPNTMWYDDVDQDGFGDAQSIPIQQCNPIANRAANNTDCVDTNANIHPNMPLQCDDIDHNCDGLVDNDFDFDGLSDVTCGGSDCDDNDANISTENGLVPSCAGIDCNDIIQIDPLAIDGLYWIDPDGNGPFEVYCDMDPNQQIGWTLVMRNINTNIPYDSTLWTSTAVYDESNYSFTTTGYSKYDSFNRVPFTQLRSSYPQDFSNAYTETFANGYSSALALFSGGGLQLSLQNSNESYFLGMITDGFYAVYGCTNYRNYGINQQSYLGTGFINGGSYCDWNGGARWGLRYNASHSNTGNHMGIGWGNYTTIGYAPQNISQLLWVR